MDEEKTSWLERVEAIIQVLEGSTIGELELTEAGQRLSFAAILVWLWSHPLLHSRR